MAPAVASSKNAEPPKSVPKSATHKGYVEVAPGDFRYFYNQGRTSLRIEYDPMLHAVGLDPEPWAPAGQKPGREFLALADGAAPGAQPTVPSMLFSYAAPSGSAGLCIFDAPVALLGGPDEQELLKKRAHRKTERLRKGPIHIRVPNIKYKNTSD